MRPLRCSVSDDRSSRGFTLLEMVMALLVMAVLAGLVAGLQFDRDEHISRAALELEKLARKASRSASAYDREYRLRFEPDRFLVVPLQTTDFDGEERQPPANEQWQLHEGVVMKLKLWATNQWIVPKQEDWVFTASGISEPLTVRFSEGEAFIEMDFAPLTGTVEERRAYLP